jgi:hypothetical protein
MAIKKFKFNYDFHEAEAVFEVDTELFTDEHAKLLLEFFSWDYDEYNSLTTELLKKYAMKAIKTATMYDYNVNGVIRDFKNQEGFAPVDGSIGITLISVYSYEFDYDKLDYNIIEYESPI